MFFKKEIEHKSLFRIASVAFCLTIVVVILGAFTRLVDAGLGCPDWPGCYGHLLWPNETAEIIEAEKKFPGSPVETDKTWPEMVHRYFAGTLGLLVLGIAVLTVRASKKDTASNSVLPRVPLKLSLGLLCLVILQAAFGMWTVTLKLWPQVVTAHLLGGFSTLSLLWLYMHRLAATRWVLSATQRQRLNKAKLLLMLALVFVVLQITLGGWVSANYAALACPDLPLCLGQWMPPTDFKTGFNFSQKIGANYLGGQLDNHARTAIHLSHRMGAVLVTLTLIILGVQLWRINHNGIRHWVCLLWGVLLLQLTLGVSNIVFFLPLSIAVGHNITGAVLLLVTIAIVYRAYSAKRLNQNPENNNERARG